MDDNWGDDAIFKDVPDMLLDEIFTGCVSVCRSFVAVVLVLRSAALAPDAARRPSRTTSAT